MSPQPVSYIVRKTYFDDRPSVDWAEFRVSEDFLQREREGRERYTPAYTEALELAQRLRGHCDGYAVIDPVYADGRHGSY